MSKLMSLWQETCHERLEMQPRENKVRRWAQTYLPTQPPPLDFHYIIMRNILVLSFQKFNVFHFPNIPATLVLLIAQFYSFEEDWKILHLV